MLLPAAPDPTTMPLIPVQRDGWYDTSLHPRPVFFYAGLPSI